MSHQPNRSTPLLLSLLSLSGTATAQGWINRSNVLSPPARQSHAMAFDVARGMTVMFGGDLSGVPLGDTWEWDGNAWIPRISATYPPAQFGHAMTYDSVQGKVVLVGAGPQGMDVWYWSGVNWSVANPSVRPPNRYDHAIAFDSARNRLVMVGGSHGPTGPAETWEWDGIAWLLRSSAQYPVARSHHAMAYYPIGGVVVMTGGTSNNYNMYLGDTWLWDGSAWSSTSTSFASVRQHAMVYDSQRAILIAFGGFGSNLQISYETSTWSGANWSTLVPTSPGSAREGHGMAFDSIRNRAVVFGGATPSLSNETWELATVARTTVFGVGCGTPPLSIQAATGSRPILASNYATVVNNVPSPFFASMAVGFSRTSLGPFSLPLPLAGFGLTGCSLYHDLVDLQQPCTPAAAQTFHTIVLPAYAGLLGFTFYLQAWAIAPGANPAGVIVSNGLEVEVGNI